MDRDFVVPCVHRIVHSLQRCGEFLGHVNRAMLATGAAQRYRQIAAMDADILRDPACEERENVIVHLAEQRLPVEKFGDWTVQSGQRSEFGIPVRIRQGAQVKDEVCISRNTVFETE